MNAVNVAPATPEAKDASRRLRVSPRPLAAALALAAFCVLTSVLFHAFWAAPEAGRMGEQIEFLKDFALAGGLLVLAAFGAGALSVDAKRNAA